MALFLGYNAEHLGRELVKELVKAHILKAIGRLVLVRVIIVQVIVFIAFNANDLLGLGLLSHHFGLGGGAYLSNVLLNLASGFQSLHGAV